MAELLTAAEMRAVEEAAIASGAVTGRALMERAGRGTVEAMLDWRPDLAAAPHRAVVLCGPGNNGGDGFVIARLLRQRGWEVEVFLYGRDLGRDPAALDMLPPDAALNARAWVALGQITPIEAFGPAASGRAEIVVDALFGGGLSRPLASDLMGALSHLADEEGGDAADRPSVIAVDSPSGVCLDSGRLLGGLDPGAFGLRADFTVTFHTQRLGHVLGHGPELCGRIAVVDIGLPEAPCRQAARLAAPAPGLSKRKGHKYNHGHALVLSGGVGRGGAARLAARAALRVGAGLVTLGCPPAAMIENAARLDAIMLRPIGEVEALTAVLDDPRITALCLGPGLGVGAQTRARVDAACRAGRPTVLDADALTSFAEDPEAIFRVLHPACVLTPHDGEFGRLFPDILAKLTAPAERGPAYSKVDATREAAARAGCVVLLKGADTVIATPEGRAVVNAAAYGRAVPWLATAGAGDVLAGLIAGLLARGFTPLAAGETGAWLHVEAARHVGPGLIAEDLADALPQVFLKLGI